jgi:hypothetical protein
LKDEIENYRAGREIPKSQRKVIMTIGDIDSPEKFHVKEETLNLLKEKLYLNEEFIFFLNKHNKIFLGEFDEYLDIISCLSYPLNTKILKFFENLLDLYNSFLTEKINQYKSLSNEQDSLNKKNSQLKQDNIMLSKLVLELKKSKEKAKFNTIDYTEDNTLNNMPNEILATNSSMVFFYFK